MTTTAPALSGEYPTTWDEVVGQEKAKRQLRTALIAAQRRGKPMPHTLLASGTPGVGKTALALLCGIERGGGVKVVSGRIRAGEARILLADMSDGDVLVIDEAHRLVETSKKDIEWLLHYMENGVIVGPRGPEPQPQVTIIACTTDAGRLPDTILERFRCTPELLPYTDEEALAIARIMATRVFDFSLKFPTPDNCAAIARAANNNPRQIRILLENLADEALVTDCAGFADEGYDLSTLLDDHGLTPDGLTSTAQRYLTVLRDEWNGEPAGAAAMKERLREPGGLDYTERLLQDKGLIALTKRGRCLTQSGIKRAKELSAA